VTSRVEGGQRWQSQGSQEAEVEEGVTGIRWGRRWCQEMKVGGGGRVREAEK
jgi:hypothetical protein